MGNNKDFAKNIIMTLGRQVTAILLGLLSSIIIARWLGSTGNGQYNLIILVPTMLFSFLNLGIGTSSVYFVGKNNYNTNTVYKTNTIVGLVIGIAALIIGFIYLNYFGANFTEGVPLHLFYLALLFVPLLVLNEFYLVLFQAKSDFASYNTISLLRQISALLFLIIGLMFFKWGLIGAVVSFIFSLVIQYILSMYFFKKRLKLSLKQGSFSVGYFKESLRYGYKAHFSNILSFINYRADIFLIGFFLNPQAVGIYGVAVGIAEKLWVASQAISTVLFPKVASINDDSEKNRLTSYIARNILVFSLFTGLVFYLAGKFIIVLMYGKEYVESAYVLYFLLPGIIFFSVDRILSNDLAGRGMPQLNMYTSLFTVISNIVLNIILIPKYGIAGSAFSTSLTYTLCTMIKIVIFKRVTGTKYKDILFISKADIIGAKNMIKRVGGRG
jgi:O-antigen/teichoic acid export membrane protein